MQKSAKKIVRKKRTASSPMNKKVIKRQKTRQGNAPEILKPSKKAEKVVLLNANQIRTSLKKSPWVATV